MIPMLDTSRENRQKALEIRDKIEAELDVIDDREEELSEELGRVHSKIQNLSPRYYQPKPGTNWRCTPEMRELRRQEGNIHRKFDRLAVKRQKILNREDAILVAMQIRMPPAPYYLLGGKL